MRFFIFHVPKIAELLSNSGRTYRERARKAYLAVAKQRRVKPRDAQSNRQAIAVHFP